MKVKELMKELGKLNPELPIILQTDPEGNGYYKISGADADSYVYKEDVEDYFIESVRGERDLRDEMELEEPFEGYTQVAVIFP